MGTLIDLLHVPFENTLWALTGTLEKKLWVVELILVDAQKGIYTVRNGFWVMVTGPSNFLGDGREVIGGEQKSAFFAPLEGFAKTSLRFPCGTLHSLQEAGEGRQGD